MFVDVWSERHQCPWLFTVIEFGYVLYIWCELNHMICSVRGIGIIRVYCFELLHFDGSFCFVYLHSFSSTSSVQSLPYNLIIHTRDTDNWPSSSCINQGVHILTNISIIVNRISNMRFSAILSSLALGVLSVQAQNATIAATATTSGAISGTQAATGAQITEAACLAACMRCHISHIRA